MTICVKIFVQIPKFGILWYTTMRQIDEWNANYLFWVLNLFLQAHLVFSFILCVCGRAMYGVFKFCGCVHVCTQVSVLVCIDKYGGQK